MKNNILCKKECQVEDGPVMHARMLRRVQQVHGHKLIGSTLVAFIPCQATLCWNSSPIFPLSWQAPVIGRNAELHISLNLSPDVKIGRVRIWEALYH